MGLAAQTRVMKFLASCSLFAYDQTLRTERRGLNFVIQPK